MGVKGDGSGSLPPCLCGHQWWRHELSRLSPPCCWQAVVVAMQLLLCLLPLVLLSGVAGSAVAPVVVGGRGAVCTF
jgi:hypothetical protein